MTNEAKNEKDNAKEIKRLISLIDQNPAVTKNYNDLAEQLFLNKSADLAQELLQKALTQVNEPEELYYNLALADYFVGDFAQSIVYLDKLPQNDAVLYQKGLAYFKQNQFQKALAFAMSIQEKDNNSSELLADIWLGLGQMAQAKENLLAISAKERSAKVLFLLGVTTLENDQDASMAFFDQAEKKDPKYFQETKKQYDSLLNLVKQGKNNEISREDWRGYFRKWSQFF